jgi:SMC interacting uncharacterized protein involved in chromosome segregation
VFPRADPYTAVWDQADGKALERGLEECQNSDNTAMSTMFAMMKTYVGLERSLGRVIGSLDQAREDRRQLQRDHDSEIEKLQAELEQVTLERDQAIYRDEVVMQEIQRLTTANRNSERMLIHVLH